MTTTRVDPRTGEKITTTDESEDSSLMKNMSGFGGGFFRSHLQPEFSGVPDDEEPGIWNKM